MRQKIDLVQVNVRVRPEHFRKLNKLAEVTGVSQSEFVRRLIEAADTPQVTRWLPTFSPEQMEVGR